MPISKSDALFQLVKSLSKAEKRQFRLYATRNHADASLKFMELFDIIDKFKNVDDKLIINKLKDINKPQYANLKRHLYSQILTSLRIIQKTKRANIQVREHIDFAYILYGKGLYLQALKILQMAKREAIKHHLNYMQLTIVEFEKIIETRHITRSGEKKVAGLIQESSEIDKRVSDAVYLSNLRLELHGMYLKGGHNSSEMKQMFLKNYFHDKLRNINEHSLGVIEKVYLYQSHVWYAYIQLDFRTCMTYAIKWVRLFQDNPQMINRDVDLYLRAYHYITTACFHLRDVDKLEKYHAQLEAFRKKEYKKFNGNSQIISFLYVHTGRLNRVILTGDFQEGLKVIPRTLKRISRYRSKLDDHRILVFYYKIAWIYFGAGETNKAIHYLNKIVNHEVLNLREDLQLYARLMFLMCQYESNDFEMISYQLRTFRKFFKTVGLKYRMKDIAVRMFNELYKKGKYEHKDILKRYSIELQELKADNYHRTALTYLDMLTWIEAKVNRKPLSGIVRNL